MIRVRSALLAGIAWVLVVVTCATGVWFVIDRVGRDVLSSTPVAVDPPTNRPSTASRPEPPVSSTTTRPAATSHPPTISTSPPATQSVPSSGTRTGEPQPSRTPTPPPPATEPPVPPPTSSPPASRSGAVAVTGGRVGAACTGDQISLKFVTPESGWSFTVETESDHLGVHFVATNGGGETEVSARCTDGTPTFDTSAGGDGGGR